MCSLHRRALKSIGINEFEFNKLSMEMDYTKSTVEDILKQTKEYWEPMQDCQAAAATDEVEREDWNRRGDELEPGA